MRQDLDGLQNFANALGRGAWVKLGDVLKETVEIVKNLRSQLDARNASAHLANLRAAGLRAGSLRARSAR